MAYYTVRYSYTTVRTRLEFSETDLRTVSGYDQFAVNSSQVEFLLTVRTNILVKHHPDLLRLQRLQNRAARLIFLADKRASATPFIRELHWLPVQQRINLRSCCMCTIAFMKHLPDICRIWFACIFLDVQDWDPRLIPPALKFLFQRKRTGTGLSLF